MGVSPGTGAGIGIALALLALFIAGPVAYKHRKRQRALAEAEHPTDGVLEAGQKPQLEDTAVSHTTWRNSNYASSNVSGPEMASLNESAGLGIQRRPISEAAGSEIGEVDGYEIPAEVDATDEGQRAELAIGAQSPYDGRRAELRSDALTPPEALEAQQHPHRHLAETNNAEARPTLDSGGGRMTSDTSLPNMPVLPGPVLPPKNRK